MAKVVKPVHHLMKGKYQCFEAGTDFVMTNIIDVEASLGRPGTLTIITEAADTIEVRLNVFIDVLPLRQRADTVGIHSNPDIAAAHEEQISEQHVIRVEPNKMLTLPFPVYDIEIVGTTGTTQLLVY